MRFISKYIQQIILVLVLVAVCVGGAYAAGGPISFNFTALTSGFVRKVAGHPDPQRRRKNFFYGYGFDGNSKTWGYGYGYYGGYITIHGNDLTYADQGFGGDDGSPTIESVTVEKTSATVVYTTPYLAKGSWGYGFVTPVTRYNAILAEQEDDFNSGERTVTFTDLQCGTFYYFAVAGTDAGKNSWIVQDSFTTKSCKDAPNIGGSSQALSNNMRPPSNRKPLTVNIPAIFLSFGSIGVDVRDLQMLLNSFGIILDAHNGIGAPGHESDYFGHKTEAALKRFQSVFGLSEVDGIYGPETQRVMYERLTQ